MHRLAVVTERFLREAFGVTALFRALCPCVTIGVKGYAFDSKADTAPLKFLGPVFLLHQGYVGE